jgi:GNAT superfamily N-acetyltransferase
MRVRRAAAADVADLARLNAEVQEQHRASLPDVYRETPVVEIEAWMRRLLGDPEFAVLIADEGGGPAVGFAVVRRDTSPGHTFAFPRLRAVVESVGVRDGVRRRGAGRALMATAEEVARAWGATSVVLDVQAFNAGAERFYAALGYRPSSTRLSKRL